MVRTALGVVALMALLAQPAMAERAFAPRYVATTSPGRSR